MESICKTCSKSEKGPTKNTYIWLNSLVGYDKTFTELECRQCDCNGRVYTSEDPRLISSSHNGDRLALDNVPRNGKVPVSETDRLPVSGTYDNYGDIVQGDISYYYDSELATPFIPQLYTTPNVYVREDFIDPMDSYKPHYCRVSLDSCSCLSWIRDSQFHREDLMSKQAWRRNQNDFNTNLHSSCLKYN